MSEENETPEQSTPEPADNPEPGEDPAQPEPQDRVPPPTHGLEFPTTNPGRTHFIAQAVQTAAIISVVAGLLLAALATVQNNHVAIATGLGTTAFGFWFGMGSSLILNMKKTVFTCAALALLAMAAAIFIALLRPSELTELIPANAESVLILDLAAVRDDQHRFPGDYQTFLEELQTQVTHDLQTVEIDAHRTDLYLLIGLEDEDHPLTVARGGLVTSYIADDWNDRGITADSYRGHAVWDQGQRRHTLLDDQDTAAVSPSQGTVNTFLRTASGDLDPLAKDATAAMYRLLEAVGSSPARAAVTNGPLATFCPVALQGCQGYAFAYDSFDPDSARTTVRAAILFSNPRRAERALDEYDSAEQFLKTALRTIAGVTSTFGVLPAGTITIDALELDGEFLNAEITIDEEQYSHPVPKAAAAQTTTEPPPSVMACDDMLRRELPLRPHADTAPEMNDLILEIQNKEDNCLPTAWQPIALTAPLAQDPTAWHPNSPQSHCFDQNPNDAGEYTVGALAVPGSLVAQDQTVQGSAQLLPNYQSTRDDEGNIIIYFPVTHTPADGASCWMFLSGDHLWAKGDR